MILAKADLGNGGACLRPRLPRAAWRPLTDASLHSPVELRRAFQASANYRAHVIDLAVAHHDGPRAPGPADGSLQPPDLDGRVPARELLPFAALKA